MALVKRKSDIKEKVNFIEKESCDVKATSVDAEKVTFSELMPETKVAKIISLFFGLGKLVAKKFRGSRYNELGQRISKSLDLHMYFATLLGLEDKFFDLLDKFGPQEAKSTNGEVMIMPHFDLDEITAENIRATQSDWLRENAEADEYLMCDRANVSGDEFEGSKLVIYSWKKENMIAYQKAFQALIADNTEVLKTKAFHVTIKQRENKNPYITGIYEA